MTYDEVLRIIEESVKEDWLFNDQRGVYTFKHNLHVRIEKRDIDYDADKFQNEHWAIKHPDSNAYLVTYEVFYGASFVKEVLMVSVDGHRATLPLPDRETLKVSSHNFSFAQIVDQLGTLEEYMKRSGLKVES